jgi:23S rRNA (adenine2030-N6)-methyltransferase
MEVPRVGAGASCAPHQPPPPPSRLNYRHIFHAGNFADVFKHALLVPLVRAMQLKEKGLLFLDTHAGVGAYDLASAPAGRTLEFDTGIGRLWKDAAPPPAFAEYLEFVRRFNASRGASGGELRYYPGSPRLVAGLLRPQDRLALTELHPEDCTTLRAEFAGDRGISIQCIDAYSALRAYLPPPERRALVLIDPPYEDHNEAVRIHAGLDAALQRFPDGVFVLWYPIKDRSGAAMLQTLLLTLPEVPILAAELMIRPDASVERLNGCGLAILNPPWQVDTILAPLVQALGDALATGPGAGATLAWWRAER